MTEDELAMQAAAQEAAQADAGAGMVLDDFMSQYGNQFSNDRDIGNAVFEYLRAGGVDTSPADALVQAAISDLREQVNQALADAAELEQQTEQQMGLLISIISNNKAAALQQLAMQQQALVDIQSKLNTVQGADAIAEGQPPITDMQPPLPEEQMANEQNMPQAGEMAPADTPESVPANEGPAPEGPAAPGPEQAPAPTEPAPAQGPTGPAQVPPTAGNVVSDVGMKNIRYRLSDATMKNIKGRVSKPKASGVSMNNNILAACQGGF